MSITRAQINKAINDLIKTEFPGIPIQSRDISKGFDRPSFYVNLETNRLDKSQFTLLRDMTCRILFFPTSRHEYKEEVYQVQDKLETLLGLNFTVGDRAITITDAETYIVDGVLHYDFNFSYYENIAEEETGELMEELKYNG